MSTQPLLACRPVEWPTSGPLSLIKPTYIYPGSTIERCNGCGREVYVGPKLQEVQEATGARAHCFPCASHPEFSGPSPEIRHMGNEYEPEEAKDDIPDLKHE